MIDSLSQPQACKHEIKRFDSFNEMFNDIEVWEICTKCSHTQVLYSKPVTEYAR